MVHEHEAKLCSDRTTVLPEILAIELLAVVHGELSGHSKSTDDLLPKEFFDGG
jgi:hypothetical protein